MAARRSVVLLLAAAAALASGERLRGTQHRSYAAAVPHWARRRLGALGMCLCGAPRPCQHKEGLLCYETQEHVGGSKTCPPGTEHCLCPCAGDHPCLDTQDHSTGTACVQMVRSFGALVCPRNTMRCEHQAYPSSPLAATPTPAPRIQSSHGRVCRCAGTRPCHDAMRNACVGTHADGSCPLGSDLCHCGCAAGAAAGRPCQHKELDICLPAFGPAATEVCPDGSLRCEQHSETTTTVAPALSQDMRCVCGGGTPCQLDADLSASHGHVPHCYEMGKTAGGDLECPTHTSQCDCGCTGATPCKHHDQTMGTNYCFAALGTHCPLGTVRCVTTPTLPSNKIYDAVVPLHTTAPPTKVACVISAWSKWSECSVTCGAGKKIRLPLVASVECEGQREEADCDMGSCSAVDCEVSGWTAWSPCSHDCGGNGVQTRRPIVTTQANRLGRQCPRPVTRACARVPCASDLHCQCNPFGRVMDPDAPPASAHEVQCTKGSHAITVLYPQKKAFFKCGYKPSTGCTCCMCHVRDCEEKQPSGWGDCEQRYFSSDDTGAVPCDCDPNSKTPCAKISSSGPSCVARLTFSANSGPPACPHDTVSCEGRQQLHAERRVRSAAGKVFLSDTCPQMSEYRPCNNWSQTSASPNLGLAGA